MKKSTMPKDTNQRAKSIVDAATNRKETKTLVAKNLDGSPLTEIVLSGERPVEILPMQDQEARKP